MVGMGVKAEGAAKSSIAAAGLPGTAPLTGTAGVQGAEAPGRPVVLQLLPSLVTGGAERGCVDVAAALAKAGGTALVASAGGPLEREITRAGGRHFTLPLDRKNPLVLRANIGRLAALIREHNVDIVHARSRAPAWSGLAAARRTKRPFLTTFHGTYNERGRLKHLYNSVMVRGDLVIAISQHIAELIMTRYGTDPSRIRLIPRGIDLDQFDPRRVASARVLRLWDQWRLEESMPVVMLPGRLTRWKGQMVLIEALARLGRTDIRCVLVGSDQGRSGYRAALEARIRELGLGMVTRLVDHCADMPAAYLLADVVVSASTDPEGFGRVMVEAQAMGRPVIATDHGGARETLLEGETGWLVPPGDPEALAARLATALTLDARARKAMAERAIAHARFNFGKDLMCARTLAVYDELQAGLAGAEAA
jgi:glycosyltransferase involved in cell wall biosynthesis